jgi:hypothetical protein
LSQAHEHATQADWFKSPESKGEVMPAHRVRASAEVKAPAEKVHAIIADYRNGHPQIVPRPPFGRIEVEQGGFGGGTIIHFQMRVAIFVRMR